jgi:DNA/RNA-binding domain of Phe-tRNA-synthetase-like protein
MDFQPGIAPEMFALRPDFAALSLYVDGASNMASTDASRAQLAVGGEDAASYQGRPRLVRAQGDGKFDTIAEGHPKVETMEPGEVVWRDAQGVTRRRWNWRQGTRTRITEGSTSMWFVPERLEPLPIDALIEAGRELAAGMRDIAPQLSACFILFDARTPQGRGAF